MKASLLNQQKDYPNFPEFQRFGIDLSRTHADVLRILQRVRRRSGIPITPSPLQGAWSRLGGSNTSRHYAKNRLADAGDVFPQQGRALALWSILQEYSEINGLGLYSDKNGPRGTPQVMVHFDLRPGHRVHWITDRSGNYWSLLNNPIPYWRTFNEIIKMDVL